MTAASSANLNLHESNRTVSETRITSGTAEEEDVEKGTEGEEEEEGKDGAAEAETEAEEVLCRRRCIPPPKGGAIFAQLTQRVISSSCRWRFRGPLV